MIAGILRERLELGINIEKRYPVLKKFNPETEKNYVKQAYSFN